MRYVAHRIFGASDYLGERYDHDQTASRHADNHHVDSRSIRRVSGARRGRTHRGGCRSDGAGWLRGCREGPDEGAAALRCARPSGPAWWSSGGRAAWSRRAASAAGGTRGSCSANGPGAAPNAASASRRGSEAYATGSATPRRPIGAFAATGHAAVAARCSCYAAGGRSSRAAARRRTATRYQGA